MKPGAPMVVSSRSRWSPPDPELLAALHGFEVDWNLVGGDVCAQHVARDEPNAIRVALWRLGDERLGGKVAQISARFDEDMPADILFELVMEGLGYSANREPMRQLAQRMPVNVIDALLALVAPEERHALALALLLGAGGFLPLSPTEAEVAQLSPADLGRIEDFWHTRGTAWCFDRLAPTSWERVRVRPANHPLIRLGMAAALLTSSFEGLTASLVNSVRTGGDPVELLIERSRAGGRAGMGEGRAIAIVASSVLPFLLALADAAGDPQLSEQASRCWEVLKAGEPNRATKQAMHQVSGKIPFGRIGERGMQGLIQLDRAYCQPRRCLECPIAHLALSRQPLLEQAALE